MGLLQMEMRNLAVLDKKEADVLSRSHASVFRCLSLHSCGKGKCRDWENEYSKLTTGEDQV